MKIQPFNKQSAGIRNYFFVEVVSVVTVVLTVVSVITFVVSGATGVTTVVVSEVFVSSVFVELSEHEAKDAATIANTSNFFIFLCFNLLFKD
jgi:hypothetical protein